MRSFILWLWALETLSVCHAGEERTPEMRMGPSGFLRADIESRIEEGADDERPMENTNLHEGDIIVDEPSILYNGMTTDAKKWNRGEIPYVIDSTLGDKNDLIKEAMKHIEGKTGGCIRFIKRSNQDGYLNIFKGKGCYSYIGNSNKQRPVSLGKGCDRFGTIVHELTHAIGFYHEHTRSDRDRHIRIFYDNIGNQFHEEFKPKAESDNRLFNQFDYNSIMLYGSKAFTINKEKPSMLKKDGGKLEEVHHKKGLSSSDIDRIKNLYRC